MSESADNIKNMSFEEALKALEAIVERLESGDLELEEAMAEYERGAKLKKYCEEKLRHAKHRIEKINLAETAHEEE